MKLLIKPKDGGEWSPLGEVTMLDQLATEGESKTDWQALNNATFSVTYTIPPAKGKSARSKRNRWSQRIFSSIHQRVPRKQKKIYKKYLLATGNATDFRTVLAIASYIHQSKIKRSKK